MPEVFLDWCEGVEAGVLKDINFKTMQVAICDAAQTSRCRPAQKTSFHDVLHAAPEPYSAIPKSHKEEEEAFGPDNDNKIIIQKQK